MSYPAPRFTALGAALGILSLGLGMSAPAHADVAVPISGDQKTLLLQMQDAFTQIAKTAEPWVVNIKSVRPETASDDSRLPKGSPFAAPPSTGDSGPASPFPRRSESTGSGVIIRDDGYIVTNDHVVEGTKTVTVTLSDGEEFTGKVASDPQSDLAVVKIDPGAMKLPAATFADSDAVRPGQWAIAIGSPFDLANTMTVGVISALGRHQLIGDSPAHSRYYPDLLQTDAAINPGNSGGPLIDIDGKVVGINVAIESPVEGNAGIGFAIPSKIAQRIVNQLILDGKVTRRYLGLAPSDLTPARQSEYGVKNGAWVMQVDYDSPAGRAGVHAADIVTSFNNEPIDSELALRLAIADATPGTLAPMTIVRDGAPVNLKVTIASPPPPADTTPASTEPAIPHKIGISVRTLSPSDRNQLGLQPTTNGAFVSAVLTNSPADAAGIEVGDVITRIGKAPIASADDASKALSAITSDSDFTVILVRASQAGRVQELATDLKY